MRSEILQTDRLTGILVGHPGGRPLAPWHEGMFAQHGTNFNTKSIFLLDTSRGLLYITVSKPISGLRFGPGGAPGAGQSAGNPRRLSP